MIAAATLFMLAQVPAPDATPLPPCKNRAATCKPWDRDWPQQPEPEKFGPGPYTLVIAEGGGFTKLEFASGVACKRARDEARRQIGGIRIQAFCVRL